MKLVPSLYIIFVRDLKSESGEVNKSLTSQEQEFKSFLNDYADCFLETLPQELPPTRGEEFGSQGLRISLISYKVHLTTVGLT